MTFKKLVGSLTFVFCVITKGSFAADKAPDHYFADSKFLVALVTGLLGLATAIFTTIRTNRHAKRMLELQANQAKKMSELQAEQAKKLAEFQIALEVKKESDNNRIKFLLAYDTDKVSQYMISLKEFSAVSQKLKDEVRDILSHFDSTIAEERSEQLNGLKKKIVDQYADHVYYFNKADKGKIAHEIKTLFIEIFGLFENEVNNPHHTEPPFRSKVSHQSAQSEPPKKGWKTGIIRAK